MFLRHLFADTVKLEGAKYAAAFSPWCEFDIGTMSGNISIDDWNESGRLELVDSNAKYNAESWQDLYDRVVDLYEEIERSEVENILIVAHSGVYHQLYRYKNNDLDFRKKVPTPQNCEIVVLKDEA